LRSNLATSLAAALQNGQPPSNIKSGRLGGGTSPSHEESITKRFMDPEYATGLGNVADLEDDVAGEAFAERGDGSVLLVGLLPGMCPILILDLEDHLVHTFDHAMPLSVLPV